MEILTKLFGGMARVKIMRLFLLNESAFTTEEIASRSRVIKAAVRKEIHALSSMGFIKIKNTTREGSNGKKKVSTWSLNPNFKYLDSIRDLLIEPKLLMEENLINRFKPVGKIKLMVVSGVFIGEDKSRVDVMIVGDKLKKNILVQLIRVLEAEIGKELDYVVFDTDEFKYRVDMYDKLVCDIIDLPHQVIVDNAQLSTYISKK